MTGSTPDWESLDRSIAGEVTLPGSAAYDRGRLGFNARYHDVLPEAIVSCAITEDVSETIAFVHRYGLVHATRSGGHCFAGHSSTHGVLIDVTALRSVSVAGGVATVGAGSRLGDVYEGLEAHGLTIPAGTCPPVGIAGLVLGGGLGILGRTYGTASDHLLQAQIVLADGRVIECDEHHHEDLFWALRGAGAGNFGVVTSFVFRTVPAPAVTNIHAVWSHRHAAAVITAWQQWAPRGPDELAASLKVTASGDGDGPPSVDVYGAFLGTESDAAEVLDHLIVGTGREPTSTSNRLMSFPETRRFWAHLGATDDDASKYSESQAVEHAHFVSKSEFFRRPLPTEAIAALVETFSRERTTGESRELDFMPWGGAYNRPRPDATAFVHRDELFQLKHAATVDPQAPPPTKQSAQRWVVRSWACVHPWGSGRVFPNFADPSLEDWPDAYYGANYHRLRRVKAQYDPANFFRFPQSLPVP
jgi:FAD/FMN-containing dehydrogenase